MIQRDKVDISVFQSIVSMLDIPTKIITSETEEQMIVPECNEKNPIWLRTADNRFCGVINDPNDVRLVLSTAKRKSNKEEPLFIQESKEGKVYYLIGYRMAYHFLPVEIIGVEFLSRGYRVPYLMWVPSGCSGRELKIMTEKARKVSQNLFNGYYGILFEFVVNTGDVFLAFVQLFFQPDEGICQLCKEGLGIDLAEVHNTVEREGIPNTSPSRELGCAIAWIIPHSGIVQSIRNIDKAQNEEGVKYVKVNIQEGDTLNHVIDIDTRNKMGYVMAVGPDAFSARNRALSAVSQIQIITSNLLP